MGEVVQTIPLAGFDPEGEPEVRVMADGSLFVVFNFMPPSWAEDEGDLGPFEDFDRQIERAVGVPVAWEDREVFLIARPRPDTISRIRTFIEAYRRQAQ